MRPGYRNPPHSREAEESVLGAVLLSEEAVNEVMDRIHPEDFYVPAHQAVFEAVRDLFNGNQPIDAVTVAEELRRRGELDKIGGVSYLTRLVDIVPSTSNVVYYAGIVEEHAKRRELIRAGASITDFAWMPTGVCALTAARSMSPVESWRIPYLSTRRCACWRRSDGWRSPTM